MNKSFLGRDNEIPWRTRIIPASSRPSSFQREEIVTKREVLTTVILCHNKKNNFIEGTFPNKQLCWQEFSFQASQILLSLMSQQWWKCPVHSRPGAKGLAVQEVTGSALKALPPSPHCWRTQQRRNLGKYRILTHILPHERI